MSVVARPALHAINSWCGPSASRPDWKRSDASALDRKRRERAHKIVVRGQLELGSFKVLETDEDKANADGDDSSAVTGMNALGVYGCTEDVARKRAMSCFRLLMSASTERAADDIPKMEEAELSKVRRMRRAHRKTRGIARTSVLERRSKVEAGSAAAAWRASPVPSKENRTEMEPLRQRKDRTGWLQLRGYDESVPRKNEAIQTIRMAQRKQRRGSPDHDTYTATDRP
ncbi:hypothetical protein DFH07DRAFT_772119 [Mycena maculata]|uniref:Uncharacterized protein n=1 Tax=Mycena maculata TaxID=230809 RepID=A0AAD7JAL7_9AGAR|nr:hypothetical protein DFH07DRAFT_772119 [Mycena maculata]